MNGRGISVSIDAARAALAFIPADDRDLWLRIGMALKSEFGDSGLELFETWSEGAASFDAKAVKSVWKSFKAGGAVTIATLIAEAKKHGFNPKQYAPAVPLSAAEKARIKRLRTERDNAAAADKASTQAAASDEAVRTWAAVAESGTSAYLVSKAVDGYGVRYAGNVLLVPLFDAAGKLWSLQEIFSNGSKKFSNGGRVSGCFHSIGDVAASDWVLIAEGYATAATLHKATGYAVVVAFDEGNIRHVAAAMRERHPAARLLICADDDSQTEAKTGKNPGIAAAVAAAKAVRGEWCKPDGLPVGKTDFNDLAAVSGLDSVRGQIAAAVAAAGGAHAVLPEAAPDIKADASNDTKTQLESSDTALSQTSKGDGKGRRRQGAAATAKAASVVQSSHPFFTTDEGGVWFHGFSQQGHPLPAQWICSPLHITAESSNETGDGCGYLLEFVGNGKPKRWAMPASMLAGDGTQYRAVLLDMGLKLGTGVTAKNQLTVYIQTQKTDVRVCCTDRIGWHGGVYVLPDRTIGEGEGKEKVMFQAAGGAVSKFKQCGTLDQWRDEVAALCCGNSRMLFCASVAFSGPLLLPARMDSGGFHLWGDSSTGKSTAFKVAGSVFGGKDYSHTWRFTDNALETVAAQHSDALLLLDEIAQVDPRVVGESVYLLGNSQGKGRATQTATARKIATWRTPFLSNGETSLATHMETAGKGTKAGHDVRMPHIPADAGKGFGIYETLNDFASGAALSDHLSAMAGQHYGTAGIAFIEYVAEHMTTISDKLSARVTALAREMCPMDSHGQVSRVAARFALVGEAGELATGAGITGWKPGEAIAAARVCFAAWLDGRGGAGNLEHVSIIRQVSGFFQAHGDSRFVWWHRAMDDHKPNTMNRAGFKRLLTRDGSPVSSNSDHHKAYGDAMHPVDAESSELEYFVMPEVFIDEICKGFNPKTVTRLLIERDLLIPEGKGAGASATRKESLPIGRMRCYRFKPGIVGAEA